MSTIYDKITILIVDDDFTRGNTLRMNMHFEPDFELADLALSFEDAQRKLFDLQPDITLIQLPLAGLHSQEDITHLAANAPETTIISLSREPAPYLSSDVVKIVTQTPLSSEYLETVFEAIRQAARGHAHFEKRVFGSASLIANDLNIDVEAVHRALHELRRLALVETYLDKDNIYWVCVLPKGRIFLSKPNYYHIEVSPIGSAVLQAAHRLFAQ